MPQIRRAPRSLRSTVRRAARSAAFAAVGCAGLLAADLSSAGTVYVSAPGTLGGTTPATIVLLTNRGTSTQTGKWLLLPTDTNGVTRSGTPTTFSLSSRQTAAITLDGTSPGLLEVSALADVFVSATYTDSLQGGVPVPTVGSEEFVSGGGSAVLQGLTKTPTRYSDLVLVNLDQAAATCTVSLATSTGTPLGTALNVSLKPLSQKRLSDVLAGLVDPAGATTVAATAICNKNFYLHGWIVDATLGATALLPGPSGSSTLNVPGEQPACPSGATCLAVNGLLHKPTQGTPVGRVSLNTPTGTFRRIRLTMDVTVDDFFPGDPDGKHLIYWFVINKNIDMPGMLYFRGPDSFTALVRHGIGVPHAGKKKITSPFAAQKGHTYRVVNDYDMGAGVYTILITDLGTGATKTILGTPNADKYTFKAGDKFIVDMGFPENLVPDEVPSYGWEYRNLKIDVIP
jgi:hypothetical protein